MAESKTLATATTIESIRSVSYTDGTAELNAVTVDWEIPFSMFTKVGYREEDIVVGSLVWYQISNNQGEKPNSSHFILLGPNQEFEQ